MNDKQYPEEAVSHVDLSSEFTLSKSIQLIQSHEEINNPVNSQQSTVEWVLYFFKLIILI